MQALAYDGYFENGRFMTSGKLVTIPENKRVIVTILSDVLDGTPIDQTENVSKRVRKIGFMDGPPLPDSFFEPLPEEELELWGL